MSHLIDDSPEASGWARQALIDHSDHRVFGKMVRGVIWTDEPGPAGEIVGNVDPSALIEEINVRGLLLFRGHDPGCPVGRTVQAKLFTDERGGRFVVAILGFYDEKLKLSFENLGVDVLPTASSPSYLRELTDDHWIDFAVDPREVDQQWAEGVVLGAPLRVKRTDLSHNAAEAHSELIRLGFVFAALLWNPFVTTIATEAGNDTYAAIREWLRGVWKKVATRRNPVVVVQSFYEGCEVSFLFRGKDIQQLYNAYDALPIAAAQAAELIATMTKRGAAPATLTYEFEQDDWYPSFALLSNGQLVSDRALLISLEKLPTGLSIGTQTVKELTGGSSGDAEAERKSQ